MFVHPPTPIQQSIAAEFGVSSATASNALSGKGCVSEAMASRIRTRAGVIGLAAPSLATPLIPQIAQAVEATAAREGFGELIADAHGNVDAQTAALQRRVQRGADGIIGAPRRGTRVIELDVPLAMIDPPSSPGNTMSADVRTGGDAGRPSARARPPKLRDGGEKPRFLGAARPDRGLARRARRGRPDQDDLARRSA